MTDIFYKTNLTGFCVDTLFKIWFKLKKKTSGKTFLNEHAQFKNKNKLNNKTKNKTELGKSSVKILLNDIF